MLWETIETIIIGKLGGEKGSARLLRKESCVSEPVKSWREKGGIIYFSVTSDGTTGEEWIARLESKKYEVSFYSRSVLLSPDFKPTKGVTTEVAVLKWVLFNAYDFVISKVCIEAERRELEKPNAEVACLIREKFTDKELMMGMSLSRIVVMSDTINDCRPKPTLLCVSCGIWGFLGFWGYGGGLEIDFGEPVYRWEHDDGFAFAVSQVSA